jgi:hypothetical protein
VKGAINMYADCVLQCQMHPSALIMWWVVEMLVLPLPACTRSATPGTSCWRLLSTQIRG